MSTWPRGKSVLLWLLVGGLLANAALAVALTYLLATGGAQA